MNSRIVLSDVYKSYTFDQDKALPPEETVARVKKVLARAGLDVLRKTLRIDKGRLDIPVFVSLCGEDALRTIGTKKQMGKGATPEQAEASALMELVERYSFFHFMETHPFRVSDYPGVADHAMPFEAIAASVHHDPQDLDRARKALEGLPLYWTWGRNLSRGRDLLVPFDWFYQINEFNGPSAGNRLEEAIVQGACEVVERHVSAVISEETPALPEIDLEGLSDPAALELVRKFERCGIRTHIRDFTLDMGIPTIGALAWDPSTFPEHSEIVFTAGTHTDPLKAFIRALTEVAQLAGDFNTRGEYVASGLPKPRNQEEVSYMIQGNGIQGNGKRVRIQDLPNLAHDNLRVEIERIVEALDRRDMDLYAVNITHPKLEIPAVYTLIPGCRFRERARSSNVPFFAGKLVVQRFEPGESLLRLDRLIQLYPDAYYLHYYRGVAYSNLGDPHKALDALRLALTLDPHAEDAPNIQCFIGICYQQMGEYARAVDELEKAVQLDPDCKEAYNAMGFCFYKQKQHLRAIECFENVLRIDPGSAIDYANIASNLKALGRIPEAIELYRMALDLDPGIEFARQHLETLLQDGETAEQAPTP